ncbi:MFS transporter [Sphingobium sp. SYK-6]|uniref:MFS transporter n=1 Tax=Sphingobium sp. (strain NBRC 103272 / SYK-6) TaxID=627192 RepID=UPI001313EB5E|nr:MFS transporter [Sphingobium sp. SYK-6]
MSNAVPHGVLYDRPMTSMQFVIVAICCLTNISDGVDIAALAFAAPVLVKDWGLRPAVLATLFGATAVGLAIGAFFVAQLADRFGRRPVTLVATGTIVLTMMLTALATSVPQLAALRFTTGLCLGTLAVTLNVMVSEFANARWRNISVAILHSGFSIGTMVGGLFAALLLMPFGWQSMFIAAGTLNAIAFVLILFLLPESPSFIVSRRDDGTLGRLNRALSRLGQSQVTEVPAVAVARGKAKVSALLAGARRNSTLLLWLSQFVFAVISYLLLNWKPTVLVNAGLSPAQAGIAGLVSGIAGIAGHMVAGYLSRDGREVRSTMIFLFMLCFALLWLGLQPPMVGGLILAASFTSFCNVGVFTGLLLIGLTHYPAAVRTASVAMLVGIARLGAISGPVFGGLLLELGLGRDGMFIVLASMALAPLIAMYFAMMGWRRAPANEDVARVPA